MNQEDRRVRKTKRVLAESLAALLQKKPLKSITVRELSDLADINRGTFYLHYKDVYDMVEQIENDILEKVRTIITSYEHNTDKRTFLVLLSKLYELLAENAPLARCLLSENGDFAFVAKLRAIMQEKCFADVYKRLDIIDNENFVFFYHFIEMGCIGICEAWLTNGLKETPEEIAAITEDLIHKGAAAVVQI